MPAIKLTVPERKFLGFCERVEDYAQGIDSGTEVFGFTSGEFSLIDVINAVVKRMDNPRMILSTWTAAKAEMDHVHQFLESGAVRSAQWIVDRSFQNRQPALCQALRAQFGDQAIRVQRVHCKFALVWDKTKRATIQTSANLNRNLRIENVSISSCPVFFSAYKDLARDIFDLQEPGDGFESSAHVTESFRKVADKPAKKRKFVLKPPNVTARAS
jgi:hypothetical protein